MILNHNHTIDGSITVHSRGGIGNQLFIFGAGLALADQISSNLHLEICLHILNPDHPFMLNQLIPYFSIELQERIEVFPIPSSHIRRRLLMKSIPTCCSYNEPSLRYDPQFFSLNSGICASGYFQSWKYLKHLSVSRVNDIGSAIHQLGESSTKFEARDIVLHFRRGDYLNPGTIEVHGVLGFDYYVRSINQLREIGFNGEIWSISESKIDDIRSLEDTIGSKIHEINGLSIWQDLSLLINAPSLVIANSTFSWMGGWLCSLDRPVIAPSPWFKTQIYDTSDLIPPNWDTVSHDF